MKKLTSSESLVMINHWKNILESEGIACELRNQHLGSVLGEIPFVDQPEDQQEAVVVRLARDDEERRVGVAAVGVKLRETHEFAALELRCRPSGAIVEVSE